MENTAGQMSGRSFASEAEQGRLCIVQRLYGTMRLFGHAHALDHGSKRGYLKPHAALLQLGWLQRSPSQVLGQLA